MGRRCHPRPQTESGLNASMRCTLCCILVCCSVFCLLINELDAAPVHHESKAKQDVDTSSVGMQAVMQEVEKKNVVDSLAKQASARVLPPGPFSQQLQVDRVRHLKTKKDAAAQKAASQKAEKDRLAKQGVSDSFVAAFHGFENDVSDATDLLKGLLTTEEQK